MKVLKERKVLDTELFALPTFTSSLVDEDSEATQRVINVKLKKHMRFNKSFQEIEEWDKVRNQSHDMSVLLNG